MAVRFVVLDRENRICSTSGIRFGDPVLEPIYEFPEDFDFLRQYDYKIVDGELVYAPIPRPESEPTEAERIAALEEALELLLSGVTE